MEPTSPLATKCTAMAPHCRVKAWAPDEAQERIIAFANATVVTMNSLCGIDTIDSVPATCSLISERPYEANASLMTWDLVHWGIPINTIKALQLVHAIAAWAEAPGSS
jgi:hypothetical protein